MKHRDIIKAYIALNKMSDKEIPLSLSYKLFSLKKMLQPQWDFQNERIESITSKYKPLIRADGSIKFRNKNEGQKCADELNNALNEIGDIDVDLAGFKKAVVSLSTDFSMSIDDIDALSPFIDFE